MAVIALGNRELCGPETRKGKFNLIRPEASVCRTMQREFRAFLQLKRRK